MKKFTHRYVTLLLLQICPAILHAQPVSTFKLTAWTTFTSAPWRDSVYRFHTFREGYVSLPGKNASVRKQKLNYNLYTEKIEVIGENQDTIPLDNYHTFKFITIGNTVFYNHRTKGFIEIIIQDSVSLGAKRFLRSVMQSGNGEVFRATDVRNATSRWDRLYQKASLYYFIDSDGELYSPSPRAVMKLFPRKKEKIRKYLKIHHVDFRDRDDLERVIHFCHSSENPMAER